MLMSFRSDAQFSPTVIGQHLAGMNLLSPLAISDEFSTVRLQHNQAFSELLHAASSSLYPQVNGEITSCLQFLVLTTNLAYLFLLIQGQQCLGINMHNPALRWDKYWDL